MTQSKARERRAALLREFEINGLSLAEFRRRAGLACSTVLGWRRKALEEEAPASHGFVVVEALPPEAEVGPQAGSDRSPVAGEHAVLSLELTRTGAVLSWPSDPACLYHPQRSGDLKRWTNLTAAPLAGTGDAVFTAHCCQTAVFEWIALLIPQRCSRKLTDRCSGLGVFPRECLFASFRTSGNPSIMRSLRRSFRCIRRRGGCRSRPAPTV